jgi:outer membrane protein
MPISARFLTGLIGLAAILSSSVWARNEKTLTVEECIRLGLENNKGLRASSSRIAAAEAKTREIGAGRLPSLKFNASYTRLSDVPPFAITLPSALFSSPTPVSFVVSPVILDNYSLKLSVQQPVFTGFRLQNSQAAARDGALAAGEDFRKDRIDLVFNIESAYWGLVKALEIRKVVAETKARFEAHLRDVQNAFQNGILTNNEVLRVQTQLSQATLMEMDAEHSIQIASLGLCSLMGIPLETGLRPASWTEPPSSGVSPASAEDPGLQALLDKALAGRPELKSLDFRVKAGEESVAAARASRYPQVFLFGNYYYSRPNQRLLPARDEFYQTWDAGIGISLDIWNGNQTKYQTQQAGAQLSQTRDILGQAKDAVAVDVSQSYLGVLQASRRIPVGAEAVRQAEENRRVTVDRFKQGLALNSEVLDAEGLLLQARTGRTQILADYELAKARLRRAVGD